MFMKSILLFSFIFTSVSFASFSSEESPSDSSGGAGELLIEVNINPIASPADLVKIVSQDLPHFGSDRLELFLEALLDGRGVGLIVVDGQAIGLALADTEGFYDSSLTIFLSGTETILAPVPISDASNSISQEPLKVRGEEDGVFVIEISLGEGQGNVFISIKDKLALSKGEGQGNVPTPLVSVERI